MAAARNDGDRTDPRHGRDRDESLVKTLVVPHEAGEFGFDFDAFEQSEAEAALRNASRHEEVPSERPAEKRQIIARNWLPPGDSVVETRPIGNMTVVTLRGRINESFRGTELGQSLHGIVVFDLSQVDRISSFGVKGWLQMMEHARFTHCYLFRCSEAVINQITMMRNFCGNGRIHSLLVPYMCGHCGEEFNVVYEAVADREAILGRSPVPVECPQCTSSASIADDPWAYLAVDDHLLDEVPADLDQVLEHLTQIHRVDPIEKFVSDEETRIRINVPLDARLRLGRALTGLEGRVSFDLTPRPELSAAGVERLIEAIRELEPEVTEVWIDGASGPLIEALLRDSPPRTYISTAWITAISPDTGIRRPVLVDVRKKRQSLIRGEIPAIEAGWARGALKYEDAESAFQAARHLLPRAGHATPIPAPIATPAPFSGTSPPPPARFGPQGTPYVHGAPNHSLSGGRPTPYPNMHQTSPGFPAVRPQPQQRSLLRNPLFIWQAAAFLAITALLASVAFTLVFYVAYTRFANLPEVAANPDGVQIPAGGGWDGTSSLPPAWVEQTLTVDGSGVRGTGIGTGETPEAAVDASRIQAVYRLVQYVAQNLQGSAVSVAMGIDPGVEHSKDVVERFMTDVGTFAVPTRVEQSVKVEADGSYTVATQHQLDAAAMQRVIDYYTGTAEFRGMKVARRFPYRLDADSVVIIKLESWFRGAQPGDPVIELQGQPIGSIEEFLRMTESAWSATPQGGKMVLYVNSSGKRSPVEFVRASNNPSRPEGAEPLELLPLDIGK